MEQFVREQRMPGKPFEQDLEALGRLAKAAEAMAQANVAPEQVPGVTRALLQLVGAEYLKFRGTYTETVPDSPPTPTPRAIYRGP